MPTYIVRRAARDAGDVIAVRGSDIFINNVTVSSKHCRIVALGGGRYEVTDSDSTNGTFIRERAAWVRISAAELLEQDELRLGLFETTIVDLLSGHAPGPRRPAGPRFERDPESGRIVEKK